MAASAHTTRDERTDASRAPSGAAPSCVRRADDVLVAQLDLLTGHLPGIIGGTVLTGAVVVAVVDAHIASSWPWWWLGLLIGVSGLRWLGRVRMLRVPNQCGNAVSRHRWLVAVSFFNASMWGVLGYHAVAPDAVVGSLAVVMVLVGLVASATGFISHLRLMYALYVFPMLVPVAIAFLSFDAPGYRTIGALVLLYMVVSFTTSRATAGAVLEGIRLRFDNLDLVDSLTEEKHNSDAARLRAERANAAKSVLLSAASHDLRQPLHSLRLFTATLSSRLVGTVDADARRLIDKIDESGRALEGLFNAILDVSRLGAGTLQPRIESIDLAATVTRLRTSFEPLAQTKGLDFVIERTDDVPLVVRSDATLLEQLLANLLGNAVRYTQTGRVGLRFERAEQGVRLTVFDTGPGIPEPDQERIFDEFVQLGNPERDRSQGIGLGLSIVRRIARLLELNLQLESALGQGTRFVLHLPPGRAEEVDDREPREAPAPLQALDGRLVLVIDDEASVREALEGLIDTWGGITVSAGSATEALELLDEIGEAPQVILSDWRLRAGETGGQAIAAVRRRLRHDVPAIIITGDVARESLLEIAETGLPVLHKPCSPPALLGLLVDALDSAG